MQQLPTQLARTNKTLALVFVFCCHCDDIADYPDQSHVCRAISFKRSILHVEFNKSHVVLRNDVQFSKSTSHLLKTARCF